MRLTPVPNLKSCLGWFTAASVCGTAHAWLPGFSEPAPSSGFVVDSSDRFDVASFWHGIYLASEGYEKRIGWTGSYNAATGAEGVTSSAFVDDVERRTNFFRALCGVPASVSFNDGALVVIDSGDDFSPPPTTTRAAAVQRAALMMSLSRVITHDPPPNLTGWTAAAWNGCKKGGLSYALFGPGAVDAYFRENVAGTSNWNINVGHRRWLLNPGSTHMATGDTPGDVASVLTSPSTGKVPTNALYVVPGEFESTEEFPGFVSYPAAGYFPQALNAPYWSLSSSSASFGSATVSMTDSTGAPVPVSIVARNSTYADPAIVWTVPPAVFDSSAGPDRTYHVTVSNITGGNQSSYSWTTTLIDPNQLQVSLPISGPGTLEVGGVAEYSVPPFPQADRIEVGAFAVKNPEWMEGAESADWIIDGTGDNYELRTSRDSLYTNYSGPPLYSEGSHAFKLSFNTQYEFLPNGTPEQFFEIDREILPSSGSMLTFKARRAYMTPASLMVVEASSDGGSTWSALAAPIAGNTSRGPDDDFIPYSLSLPSSGSAFRIRFRLYNDKSLGGFYTEEGDPSFAYGIYLDEISVSGCQWLAPMEVVEADASGKVSLDSVSGLPGESWLLRSRAVASGHAFPWQDEKPITLVGPLAIFGSTAPPSSGAKFGFLPHASAEAYKVEVTGVAASTWSEGAEEIPVPSLLDGTDSGYELLSALQKNSGSRSFRLALPSAGAADQFFELDRWMLPDAGSEIEFSYNWFKGGAQTLSMEVSADGQNWTQVWSKVGTNKISVGAWTTGVRVSLGAFSKKPVRVRFVLTKSAGTLPAFNNNSGFWIDDITPIDLRDVVHSADFSLDGTVSDFRLDEASVGGALMVGLDYMVRVVPIIGGSEGTPGATFTIRPTNTPLTGFAGWVTYEMPGMAPDFESPPSGGKLPLGLIYAFDLPVEAGSIHGDEIEVKGSEVVLSRPLDSLRPGVTYGAEFSDNFIDWSATGVTVSQSGGKLEAKAPKSTAGAFMRWKITEE